MCFICGVDFKKKNLCVVSDCVHVCVCEREGEREREGGRDKETDRQTEVERGRGRECVSGKVCKRVYCNCDPLMCSISRSSCLHFSCRCSALCEQAIL